MPAGILEEGCGGGPGGPGGPSPGGPGGPGPSQALLRWRARPSLPFVHLDLEAPFGPLLPTSLSIWVTSLGFGSAVGARECACRRTPCLRRRKRRHAVTTTTSLPAFRLPIPLVLQLQATRRGGALAEAPEALRLLHVVVC